MQLEPVDKSADLFIGGAVLDLDPHPLRPARACPGKLHQLTHE
jgi:hypothetical protein